MSTRSYIAMELDNGKYKTIYCHSDGYLTHNGALLIDHYSDRNKIEELLNLGDISYLAPNIHPTIPTHAFDFDKREEGVVVAYARDRGEKNVDARVLTLKEILKNNWIEYFYIFNKEDKWKYFTYDNEEFKDLAKDLAKEYEIRGIKKPEGFYGYFTEEYINEIKIKQNEDEGEM